MTNSADDIDTDVLAELNQQTLVDGAAIDPALIAVALDLTEGKVAESLSRLQQQGLVRLTVGQSATITPEGHERLA